MNISTKLLKAAAGQAGGAVLDIDEVFSTFVYDGNGSTQTITNNIDLSGEGGLVWMKSRTGTDEHTLMDTERGTGTYLISHSTQQASSTSNAYITSYNSNGFSIGAGNQINRSSEDFVSWTFRKEPKFFDVLTYTGNGTAGLTVNHNLGSVPGMIIVKATGLTSHWQVLHRNDGTNWKNLQLDQTGASGNEADYWGNGSSFVAPTSTSFTVGTGSNVNANGYTYIAYLFAHNNNDGGFGPDSEDIIKCGSYTGGSGNTEINLGFEPQFLMIKRTDSSEDWLVLDTMRGLVVSGDDVASSDQKDIMWNSSAAEATPSYAGVSPQSNGFKVRSGLDALYSTNGGTYIYMAIRRPDMSTPTVASSVFAVDTRNSTGDGNEPGYRSTFPVDMVIKRKDTGQSTGETHVISRLTGTKYLRTYNSTSEDSDSGYLLDYMNGFNSATSTKTDRIAWMWKRAKGYFDMVAYSGTGSGAQNVTHNLGVVPEMMWIKVRSDADNWTVYHSALGNTKRLILNSSDEASSANEIFFNNTTPTSSVFTAGSLINASHTYIAHLFATVAGVSKVGSYTGNSSSTQDIDCGFTNGAKMVILKQTSHAESWEIYDTTRALVAGNDYRLRLDATDAQATNSDFIDPLNSGFTAVADSNLNGRSYIFYAIAND